jgi:hypothetical protein
MLSQHLGTLAPCPTAIDRAASTHANNHRYPGCLVSPPEGPRGRRAPARQGPDLAYLAAFAEASQVTLVTFARAFRGKVKPLILLEE